MTKRYLSYLLFSPYLFQSVQPKVAGLDFGNEYFKVAIVKPGKPFEIVTNIHSKRKTESMVAFDGQDRYYGADAATIGVRRPNMAYAQLRRLLGNVPEDPEIVSLTQSEYHPYIFHSDVDRRVIVLEHDENQSFRAEELVAMVFTHVRQITDVFAESDVRDYVITVPDYFSQAQRQAIIDAAEISKLKVLSLIHENTAAALQLCIHTTLEENTKKVVMLYNFGSSAVQVTVVELESRVVLENARNKTTTGFKVLSKAWDTNLGGMKFDMRLAEYIASYFNEHVLKGEEDVRQVPRVMAKIKAKAQKTKIVLSANEEIPIVIQSLYKDLDLSMMITRTKFESLCTDLFDSVTVPVQQAIEKADLTTEFIEDIELIGGGVRIPKVQQKLKEFFNKDLAVHLNGDEAMALGAAFRAASLSNSFRVRHVGMADLAPFSLQMQLSHLENDDWSKKAVLFTVKNRLNTKKVIHLTHTNDILCHLQYEASGDMIGSYSITGIEKFYESNKDKELGEPKVSLTFFLDASGILSISKAEVTLEEEYQVRVEKKKPVKETAPPTDPENKTEPTKDSTEPSKDSTEPSKDSTEPTNSESEVKAPNTETNTPASDSSESSTDAEPSFTMETRKKIHRSTLTISLIRETHPLQPLVLPMTDINKQNSTSLLQALEDADNQRKANSDAKNKLEAFVYQARDRLSSHESDVEKVTLKEDLNALISQLEDTENWLYEEGEHAEAAEYLKHLITFETELTAIFFRISELIDFPNAIAKAKESVESLKGKIEKAESDRPWITESERQEAMQKVRDLLSFVEKAEKEKSEEKAHVAPTTSSLDVRKKTDRAVKGVARMLSKPKPKEPEKKNSESEKKVTDSEKKETESEKETTDSDSEKETLVSESDSEKEATESDSESKEKIDPEQASGKEDL